MALQFHKLEVVEVIKETADAVSIALKVPANLKEAFEYKPGQYLTVKAVVDGQEYRRAYSLCSSPELDENIAIATKRVDGGKVSNWLNDEIKAGSTLEVMPPMGNFTADLSKWNQKNYIFFSGGSGITPILSILRTALTTEKHSSCYLFYGNRNAESIIFHQMIKELQETYGERFQAIHIIDEVSNDWKGYTGRMDRAKVAYFLKTYTPNIYMNAEFYICGPAPMMAEVELELESRGIQKNKINLERFTAADDANTTEVTPAPVVSGDFDPTKPVKIKIILDGESSEFEMKATEVVLDACMREDLDPPYACQIAACATCRGKVLEGKVSMIEREALTDSEMEEGYVLTCQAKPLTNNIVIDYDA